MIVRQSSALLVLLVSALIRSDVLCAEDGVLAVSVSDPKGKPISGVVLSTKGDGSTGAPTDVSGKTRLRLASQTRSGSWVTLQLTRVIGGGDWVVISPWDQRAIVPPFTNETDNFVPVTVAERGSRDVLASKDALVALAARIAAHDAPKSSAGVNASAKREATIREVASEYGLSPAELDTAIRSWNEKSANPYANGIAALYKGSFADATASLTEALAQSEKRVGDPLREAKIVDAAFFLGRSRYEEGKYADAAVAFREGLKYRSDDDALLAHLALTSIQIQSQTGTATQGGTIIQAQATTQNIYLETVQRDGTATNLISNAKSTTEIQSLLGLINREASFAFGTWERQLREFYKNSLNTTGEAEDASRTAREELRRIQEKCAAGLAENKATEAKVQLFLLDGLASELAAKAGLSRPVSR